jgi:hypothetical protein
MTREIIAHDLPRSQVSKVIAPAHSVPLTAIIRWVAGVVVMRARRIDANLMFHPMLSDEMAKYAVCGRAAADIPHAEEEDTERGRGCCHSGFHARNAQRKVCGTTLYCGL